jgi:archaellum biogenesis ATPase FlaH
VQGDLADIPTIEEGEREILLNCARALTEYVEPERIYEPKQDITASGERPGDLYAKAVTWGGILEPHGWKLISQHGEYGTWRRPGKEHGLSATTGFNGSDLLYVFSSNAAPFEPQRGYSKFTAYTLLNHGGDFKKAAAELAKAGYTEGLTEEDWRIGLEGFVFQRKKSTQRLKMRRDPPVVISMAEFAAKEMTPMNELMYWGPFVFKGYLTFCVGESSAGKTVFFYRLAQALTAGKAFLGFAPPKPLRVLHIELENGDELAKHVAKVMKFHPMGWDRIGEPATYDEVIALGKGYDVIIIDSLQKFDKPKDENDNGEANAQMAQFHRVKEETGAAVIVTHNAGKGGDGAKFKMRGASARVDLSDVVFNMDITGPETRKLTIVKTRFEGLNETVEYRFAGDLDFKLIQGLTVTSDKTKDFIRRIQEIVPSEGNISRSGILVALGIKEKSPDASAIDRALDTMIKLGELQKQGRGNYYRVEASPAEDLTPYEFPRKFPRGSIYRPILSEETRKPLLIRVSGGNR